MAKNIGFILDDEIYQKAKASGYKWEALIKMSFQVEELKKANLDILRTSEEVAKSNQMLSDMIKKRRVTQGDVKGVLCLECTRKVEELFNNSEVKKDE